MDSFLKTEQINPPNGYIAVDKLASYLDNIDPLHGFKDNFSFQRINQGLVG